MWNGGKVHKISDSIIHLMRGQVYTINGKTFFTFGGAQSHDKWHRTEGKSWWAREMPSDEEYEEGLANLAKVSNKVDYIITHCGPDYVLNELRDSGKLPIGVVHDKLSNFHQIVSETADFKTWFMGHYHQDMDIDNYSLLYDWIEEID